MLIDNLIDSKLSFHVFTFRIWKVKYLKLFHINVYLDMTFKGHNYQEKNSWKNLSFFCSI